MEFFYILNRLNVATSRAKCASILVGSPQIFKAALPHTVADPVGERLLPLSGSRNAALYPT
jgi:hypothetical protein